MPEDPALWFRFEKVPRNELRNGQRAYLSKTVDQVIERVGPFQFGDEESEKMLKELD